MITGIVVLSRYNSNRLPGKALMTICGKLVLELIIERLLTAVSGSQIVIATSTEESDDAIAQFANDRGLRFYRGSLENVAQRFYGAAREQNWDYAARINGDNIFVDTVLLSRMIEIAGEGKFDFVSNVKGRTFPRGMSVEIVRLNHYELLLPFISQTAHDREHVTSYLYEHEEKGYCYLFNEELPEASGIQMALDTVDDFERTRMIMERFTDAPWKYNLKEIFSIWKEIENEKSI